MLFIHKPKLYPRLVPADGPSSRWNDQKCTSWSVELIIVRDTPKDILGHILMFPMFRRSVASDFTPVWDSIKIQDPQSKTGGRNVLNKLIKHFCCRMVSPNLSLPWLKLIV